jgi:hypothetical protein
LLFGVVFIVHPFYPLLSVLPQIFFFGRPLKNNEVD